MRRKGFVIDTLKYEIVRDVEYDDTVFDGFYVRELGVSAKEGANILFSAMTFPIECKEQVKMALEDLKRAKKEFDDLQARIYYKVFPQIRAIHGTNTVIR